MPGWKEGGEWCSSKISKISTLQYNCIFDWSAVIQKGLTYVICLVSDNA